MILLGRKNYKATLQFVNTIREGFGAEPLEKLPKGSRVSTTECVVANALKDIKGFALAGPSRIYVGHAHEHEFPTPPYVRTFMTNFDVGVRYRSLRK